MFLKYLSLFILTFFIASCTNPYEKGDVETVENKKLFEIPYNESLQRMVTSPYEEELLIVTSKPKYNFVRYFENSFLETPFESSFAYSINLSPYNKYLLSSRYDSIKIMDIESGLINSIIIDRLYKVDWVGDGESILATSSKNGKYVHYIVSIPDFKINFIDSLEYSQYQAYAYPYFCYSDKYRVDGKTLDFITILNTVSHQKDSIIVDEYDIGHFNISNDRQKIALIFNAGLEYNLQVYDLNRLTLENSFSIYSYNIKPQWNFNNTKILLASSNTYLEIDLVTDAVRETSLSLSSTHDIVWAPNDSVQFLQRTGLNYSLFEYSYTGQRVKIFESNDIVIRNIFYLDNKNKILVLSDSLYWIEDHTINNKRAWDEDLPNGYYRYSDGNLIRSDFGNLVFYSLETNTKVEYNLEIFFPWLSNYSLQFINDTEVSIQTNDLQLYILNLKSSKIRRVNEFDNLSSISWAPKNSPLIPIYGNYAYARYQNKLVIIFEESREMMETYVHFFNNGGWNYDGQSLIYELNDSIIKNQVLYLSD